VNRPEAEEFLQNRINFEQAQSKAPLSEFKLDRMRELLRRLGGPEAQYPAIHIAGTKGKGSTAVMVDYSLREAGYTTGLYTSPHLTTVEERVSINGRILSSERLVELLEILRPHVEAMDEQGGADSRGPTYFEITTAMAMVEFAERKVDYAIFEVGLGGRLDSTNVCRPCVSVITTISFDHTRQLGNTLHAIATEKAGIIKPGVPVVSGVRADEPAEAIAAKAHEQAAPLLCLGCDFEFDVVNGENNEPRFRYQQYTPVERNDHFAFPQLSGQHQVHNASVAIATLSVLESQGASISHTAIERGLAEARCPARIEILRQEPTWIVDSAHNVASVQALIEFVRAHVTGKRRLVFATSIDKDAAGMLNVLSDHFDHIYLTRYTSNPRSMHPEALAKMMPGKPESWSVHDDPRESWWAATRGLATDSAAVVAGSFFLAAELRPLVLDSLLTCQS